VVVLLGLRAAGASARGATKHADIPTALLHNFRILRRRVKPSDRLAGGLATEIGLFGGADLGLVPSLRGAPRFPRPV